LTNRLLKKSLCTADLFWCSFDSDDSIATAGAGGNRLIIDDDIRISRLTNLLNLRTTRSNDGTDQLIW
jgi:hypothetical protein